MFEWLKCHYWFRNDLLFSTFVGRSLFFLSSLKGEEVILQTFEICCFISNIYSLIRFTIYFEFICSFKTSAMFFNSIISTLFGSFLQEWRMSVQMKRNIFILSNFPLIIYWTSVLPTCYVTLVFQMKRVKDNN